MQYNERDVSDDEQRVEEDKHDKDNEDEESEDESVQVWHLEIMYIEETTIYCSEWYRHSQEPVAHDMDDEPVAHDTDEGTERWYYRWLGKFRR